ncbi:MAG: PQQ-like beta-propeller repeat protein [Pirellulaceae bacterium]
MSDAIDSNADELKPPETHSNSQPAPPKPGAGRPLRLVIPIALLVLYWGVYAALALIDTGMSSFMRFLWQLLALGVLSLAFSLWWLLLGPRRILERLLVFGVVLGTGALAIAALDRSVLPPVMVMVALPAIISLAVLWMLVTRNAAPRVQLVGLLVIPVLCWAPTSLFRMEGISGEGNATLFWRWTPSSEAIYLEQLAAKQKADAAGIDAVEPVVKIAELSPTDWPGFRGPLRDGAVRGVKIATDWEQSPPKELWRKRIGPGWSSFAVVGDVLFTQEQRGEDEAVVAYNADTGEEVWSHLDEKTRFEETLGGPGPRATPTFDNGRLYTLGATGILNCLDAASGDLLWSRSLVKDAKAEVPMWAFSASPLVVDDLVLVFAGGKQDENLLAYNKDSGEPVWTAKAGVHSYSSPHLSTLAGVPQVVFVGERTVTGFEPATGKQLWQYEGPATQTYASIQPHLLGDSQLLVAMTQDGGTELLEVTRGDDGSDDAPWQVASQWYSRDLKPFYDDFVRHDGALYGFDNSIFCSVDAATGERNWKRGRYGSGQVLLLADQGVLIVQTEQGDVVLVAADPQEHRELARLAALTGKTWNHPVLVEDRLYVRNAEEMACYHLKLAD